MNRKLMSIFFISALAVACTTTQFHKGAEVTRKICSEVLQYKSLVLMGTDAALADARTLEAKLITHDTIDGLVAACGLAEDVITRHETEGRLVEDD